MVFNAIYETITQKDKLLHFVYGFFIYLFTYAIVSLAKHYFFNQMNFNVGLLGLIVAIFIGVGKELIWDLALKKGKAESLDAVMTILPALLMFFMF